MSIQFLQIDQARQEYLSTDYFDQMNYVELLYRLNTLNLSYAPTDTKDELRHTLRQAYLQAVLDFNQEEKTIIAFYFDNLLDLLTKKANGLIPNKRPIGLIKLMSGFDWNYPYTINHVIILPTVFVQSLIDTYKQFIDKYHQSLLAVWNPTRLPYETIDQKKLILCHELIHLLQRNTELYPGQQMIFNFIYTQIWGFKKINKSMVMFPHLEEQEFFNSITNPDGYNFQWIIPVYNHKTNYQHWFLPMLSRNLQGDQLQGIMVELEEKSSGPERYMITKHWDTIDRIKRYALQFYGLDKQLYHPNEISAQLIADYVVLNHIYSQTQDTFDYYKFYRFLTTYLISANFTPFRDK